MEWYGITVGFDKTLSLIICKKVCNEILEEVIHLQEENEGVYGTRELFERHLYWEEVKQELEKL